MSINRFSSNLVCALILKRSGLGWLTGKFHQFLIVIYPPHESGGVLSFNIFISLYLVDDAK